VISCSFRIQANTDTQEKPGEQLPESPGEPGEKLH
jgi:hypothetical protein